MATGKTKILLGFEHDTDKKVYIETSHLVVTGLSQESGKTTTLESLIKRSGLKAIVFRTKIGEKSFLEGTIIPPFFRDRSDWEFIKGLIESTMKMRIDKFEQANIIQLCKQTGGNSLLDFKKKVDEKLMQKISEGKLATLTNLQAYLEKVVPKLQTITFSSTLDLIEGLNIIDLERFSRDDEVQGLIIASILEEVLYNQKDVIVVIPEAWKFIPQERGSPCKLALEEFIRQGATNHNYIWIDSQDLSGVDKTPLKQISTWILGYQSEKNEVKHTIDQLPLPTAKKPKVDAIMTLGKGVFYKATREQTVKVYVLPFWLDEGRGIKVSKGELSIDDLDKPQTSLAPHRIAKRGKQEGTEYPPDTSLLDEYKRKATKEFNELRTDFFDKITDLQQQLTDFKSEISPMLKVTHTIDEDTIVAKMLQKIPIQKTNGPVSAIDVDEIVKQVISKMPAGGSTTYTVEPLEKLKKDFLEEARQFIISKITSIGDEQKKMLKYIETQGIGLKLGTIIEKCLFKSQTSGGTRESISKQLKDMAAVELIRYDQAHSLYYPNTKDFIKKYCEQHGATDQDISQLYSHVIMSMLGEKQ